MKSKLYFRSFFAVVVIFSKLNYTIAADSNSSDLPPANSSSSSPILPVPPSPATSSPSSSSLASSPSSIGSGNSSSNEVVSTARLRKRKVHSSDELPPSVVASSSSSFLTPGLTDVPEEKSSPIPNFTGKYFLNVNEKIKISAQLDQDPSKDDWNGMHLKIQHEVRKQKKSKSKKQITGTAIVPQYSLVLHRDEAKDLSGKIWIDEDEDDVDYTDNEHSNWTWDPKNAVMTVKIGEDGLMFTLQEISISNSRGLRFTYVDVEGDFHEYFGTKGQWEPQVHTAMIASSSSRPSSSSSSSSSSSQETKFDKTALNELGIELSDADLAYNLSMGTGKGSRTDAPSSLDHWGWPTSESSSSSSSSAERSLKLKLKGPRSYFTSGPSFNLTASDCEAGVTSDALPGFAQLTADTAAALISASASAQTSASASHLESETAIQLREFAGSYTSDVGDFSVGFRNVAGDLMMEVNFPMEARVLRLDMGEARKIYEDGKPIGTWDQLDDGFSFMEDSGSVWGLSWVGQVNNTENPGGPRSTLGLLRDGNYETFKKVIR